MEGRLKVGGGGINFSGDFILRGDALNKEVLPQNGVISSLVGEIANAWKSNCPLRGDAWMSDTLASNMLFSTFLGPTGALRALCWRKDILSCCVSPPAGLAGVAGGALRGDAWIRDVLPSRILLPPFVGDARSVLAIGAFFGDARRSDSCCLFWCRAGDAESVGPLRALCRTFRGDAGGALRADCRSREDFMVVLMGDPLEGFEPSTLSLLCCRTRGLCVAFVSTRGAVFAGFFGVAIGILLGAMSVSSTMSVASALGAFLALVDLVVMAILCFCGFFAVAVDGFFAADASGAVAGVASSFVFFGRVAGGDGSAVFLARARVTGGILSQ